MPARHAADRVRRVACACLALASFVTTACTDHDEHPRQSLEANADGSAFVDDSRCVACHEAERHEWTGSHHDLAMQVASPATVLADFDNTTFIDGGDTIRFATRGDHHYVTLVGPDGAVAEFEVRYTFGVEPLQQYLVGLGGGRLHALTVAWDTDRRQWFDLLPDEQLEPGDPLHWTGRLHRWNDRCAECHSTDLRVNYDPESDVYATTWAAIDVGCQACHGPGARHVAEAESETFADSAYGLVVRPGDGVTSQIDMCGRCHARRARVTAEQRPGRSLHDDYALALLREDLYHADGQILEEVYVTGSFLQSLMYRRGVVCTDCHDAHSGRTLAADNSLCTRCHAPAPAAAYPTLRAADYDSPAHHHHEPDGPGSACVDCHMPPRTYMQVDPRRDHSLRVPRPDLSVAIGTPNACTGCHADRPADWAVAAIDGWYTSPSRPPHWGEVFAAARAGEANAAPRLARLAADTAAPAIVRATAIDHLGAVATREAVLAVAGALADRDPLIRAAAVNSLGQVPAQAVQPLLVPLLADRFASVRLGAARMLAPVAAQIAEPGIRAALDSALAEYEAAQLAQADQPESHHNLGDLNNALGRPRQAEAAYLAALRIDSTFVPARVNLAMLYNGFGRNAEAENLLRQAIALQPEMGELHYSLGLLLAEQNRLDEAAAELATAADLMPGRARVHFNLGMALQAAGHTAAAEAALLRAHAVAPDDPAYVNALAHHYRDRSKLEDAERFARLLIEMLPDDPGARRLLQEILGGG